MFRKLLSNLPFNPSLIHQVAFYARRLHREEGLRRSGLALLILSMLLQLFAVVSPPQPSLAASGNDILHGGFTSRADAVNKCRSNTQSFATILAYYQITCDALANSTKTTLNSRAHNGQLDSMGRWSYGPTVPRTGKPTNEYPVSIGGTTYYMRNLWAWDSRSSSTYDVLRVTNARGQTIYILFICGNIVTIDRYSPPSQPPPARPATAAIQVKACDAANRRIFFGGYAFDEDRPGDSLSVTLFIDGERIGNFNANVPRPDVNRFFNISGNHGFEITLNDRSYLDNRPHTAYVTAAGIDTAGRQDGNNRRSNIVNFGPCSIPTTTTPTPPPSRPPSVPPPTDACPYPEFPGNQQSPSECRPCEESSDEEDAVTCLALSKAARNDTQNVTDANGTTAAAGDRITYLLTVKNTGERQVNDFVIEENLADVMEYTERVVSLDGGTMNNDHIVRWPAVDIPAGASFTKAITIQIKETIPETPQSVSNPGSFDLMLTNVYGNAINIKLPGSPAKIVEQTTTTLPNTGPGENIAILAMVVAAAAYFFARTRLMAKELDLVREDYAGSGGI